MALAANVRQYVPPKRIRQMEDDLRDLAKWWDEGPWGWSLNAKQRYKNMGICSGLPSDEWLDIVRQLSSREYACTYIKQMLHEEMNDDRLVGRYMRFCKSIEHFDNRQTLIFKSPWSSSGRGVFTSHNLTEEAINKRLQGFLNTQKGYAVDYLYDKALDFAMEFYVNVDHTVDFLGYSVFHAEATGTYGYNYVESQEKLKERIDVDENLLECLVNYHKSHLCLTPYHGPVGIDMLRCKDGRVHPCVEINLRMNMGILAILLYNRFGPDADVQLTPKKEQGFEAKIEGGKLMITYSA